MMSYGIFAGQMADVYGQFFGNALRTARFPRRNCRMKSLILGVIKQQL